MIKTETLEVEVPSKNVDRVLYVKIPENHIVIDFDIPDKDGNKCSGMHLHFSGN